VREITVWKFKSQFASVIEEVRKTRKSIVITKNGKVVAKLIPPDKEVVQLLGRLKEKVRITGDIESPLW
jgi:prevent-host-death family protein